MTYFVPLGTTISLYETTVNGSKTPTSPDAAAAYRIYGPTATTCLLNGSFSGTEIDHSNAPWFFLASGVAVTSGNGFASGNTYTIRTQWAISSTNFCNQQTLVVT